MTANLAVESQAALKVDQAARLECRQIGQAARFLQHIEVQAAGHDLDGRKAAAVDCDAVADAAQALHRG